MTTFNGHLEKAVVEEDESFVYALAGGLCNMGEVNAVKLVTDVMASSTHISDDMPYIIGESLKNIQDTSSIPVLGDIVREQIPGYEGAIKALLHLGESGVYEVAEILGESDKDSEVFKKLDTIVSEMDYDEEAHLTFEKLSLGYSEYSQMYWNITAKIEEKQYN